MSDHALLAVLVVLFALVAPSPAHAAAPAITTVTASVARAGTSTRAAEPGARAERDGAVTLPKRPPAPFYARNLGELADLVRADPVVTAQADRLLIRRDVGLGVIGAGLATGIGLIAYSIGFAPKSCDKDAHICTDQQDHAMLAVGAAVLTAGIALGLFVGPREDDLADLLASWNGRHADRPLALDGVKPRVAP